MVEFALGVPEEVFEPRNGGGRYLFRSATADILSHEVAWAPKCTAPRQFEMTKRLWLAVSKQLLQEEAGLFESSDEFVDGQALYQIIKQIVAQDNTDFDNIENIGAVGPAVVVAVLNRVRGKRRPNRDPHHSIGKFC